MDDATRFTLKLRELTEKKYLDGHAEHTEDCMSPWAEARRVIMTPETVAANHRLHMWDVENPADEVVPEGDPDIEAEAEKMYMAYMEEKAESQGVTNFLSWGSIMETSRATWRLRARARLAVRAAEGTDGG